MWCKKNILIVFLVPFVVGGIFYSYIAVSYLSQLPDPLNQTFDKIFAVYISFIDMGTTCGLGSLILFSLFHKLVKAIKRVKSSFQKVAET